MLTYGKYLLPALLALIFVWLSRYPYSCVYFPAILLIANVVGNKIGGEFTNEEMRQEINYFQTNTGARIVKLSSAFIFLSVIGWCGIYVDRGLLTAWEVLGFSLTAGFITGCFVVTLAHDLLHARTRFERSVANVLLVVAGIPHFTNDHLLGHHRLIGLAEDETTAKYGDTFYRYFRKAAWHRIKYSFLTSYDLPTRICRAVRRQNIGLALCLGLIYGAIGLVANHPVATATFFFVQGLTAYILYELINYIQHYGLRRTTQRNGKPESVKLEHAWNCYYKYSNYLLFMLPLHSVHHACPHPHKGANVMGPRLPYVYFVMVALALVPRLWFRRMNPLARSIRLVCWGCLLVGASAAYGQGNVGLRFVPGTWHPKGNTMAFLMPNRLDPNARFVLNWGFIGSYQYYFHKRRWSVKVAQGAYSDCAKLFAGHTHVGFRANLLNNNRHFLEIGFGPTFVYRQTWYRFPDYRQETGLLKNTDKWQWNLVWYGGEIEYDYKISPHIDLTLNAIPGPPDFIAFGVGARYWPQARPGR